MVTSFEIPPNVGMGVVAVEFDRILNFAPLDSSK